MENTISIFKFADHDVRITIIDGEPWFVAKDVCEALAIKNNRDAMSQLEDDEKGVAITDTPGGKQELTTVNEPGLYSLILRSRKPEAKVFKHWITHRVLPSIRKTGAYAVNQDKALETQQANTATISPATLETLAKALLIAQETISKLQQNQNPKQGGEIFSPSAEKSNFPENADLPLGLKKPIGCTLVNTKTGEKVKFASLRSATKFLGYPHLSITRKHAKSIVWGDWVFSDI